MIKLFNIGKYSDILNAVGKWKIVDMKALYDLLPKNESYESFKRKVRELERMDLLKSKTHIHNKKYIYLTQSGFSNSTDPNKLILNEDILTHDLLASEIIINLMEYSYVTSGECYPKKSDLTIEPDGLIIGSNNKTEKAIAVEVELTQKSSTRVREKIGNYHRTYDYDLCLFITNKRRIVDTYCRFLNEFDTDCKKKFIFIYSDQLYAGRISLESSQCTYMNKEIEFNSIFGNKRLSSMASHPIVSTSRPDRIHEQNPTFTNARY